MNYFAHIYLSQGLEYQMFGNFIGDFISNKDVHKYRQEIIDGVMLHRIIDSFTDNHPLVRQGTSRLRSSQGKYAPVVIDILYDFLLANNWSKFSHITRHNFNQRTYTLLLKHVEVCSPRIQKKVRNMIDGDFLTTYNTMDGLDFILEQMDRRTKFTSNFREARSILERDYDRFNEEFLEFFPEINVVAAEFLGIQ